MHRHSNVSGLKIPARNAVSAMVCCPVSAVSAVSARQCPSVPVTPGDNGTMHPSMLTCGGSVRSSVAYATPRSVAAPSPPTPASEQNPPMLRMHGMGGNA